MLQGTKDYYAVIEKQKEMNRQSLAAPLLGRVESRAADGSWPNRSG
jgi:hypothetical protein